MANNVIVSPSASYTVAAEDIGVSVEVQRVKVVLGTAGVDGGNVGLTNPMPVTGTVAVPAGLSVSAQVSGTVTVVAGLSVSAQVSGTVTVAAGLSVSAVVSGTVTAAVPAGLSVSAVVSGTVTAVVTGPVSISAMPAVSISVSAVLGTVITVLGTLAVNVVAGGAGGGSVTTAGPSISATGQVMWIAGGQGTTATPVIVSGTISVSAGTTVISGTVSISGAAGGGSVTTAVPSVSATGQIMWIVGGQSTTAFPVVVTGTVTAGAGTTVVSIGNVVPVTTAASVSVTGLPVWLNPTQAVVVNTIAAGFSVNALVTGVVSVSVLPAVSISVSAVLGTVITILGTQVVSVVPGVTVAVSGYSVTTATPSISATGAVVWLANTVTVTVTATVTGSLIISGIAVVTTQASVSVSGLPVWLNPTQGVTILGVQLVSVSAVVPITTQASVSVSGLPVWMNPTQGVLANISVSAALGTVITILGTQMVSVVPGVSVVASLSAAPNVVAGLASGATGVPVWPGTPAYQPVLIMVTSTAGLSAGSIYLMTVWTAGAQAAAGTSAYAVPAGKNLRLLNMQAGQAGSAAILGTIQFMVIAATATASMVSGSIPTQGHPIILQMQLSTIVPSFASIVNCLADIPAATTIGIFVTMGTSCTIPNIIVQGYLF